MLTATQQQLKLWDLRTLKCIKEIASKESITRLQYMQGMCVVGTESGALHLLKFSGDHIPSSKVRRMSVPSIARPSALYSKAQSCESVCRVHLV